MNIARPRKRNTDISGTVRNRDGLCTSPQYSMFMYIQLRTCQFSLLIDVFIQLDDGIVIHFIPHFDLIMNVTCRVIAERT